MAAYTRTWARGAGARGVPQPSVLRLRVLTFLSFAPNRFNSLLGGGRAAELAGARSKAETYYSQLLALCKNAESQRPELHLAKSFLEKQARLGP